MKNKGLLLVVFLLIVFVVAILFTPTPTDWSFNYSKYSKAPHGSYILFEELNEIFPNAEIIVSDTTATATLEDWNKPNTAYIIIGSDNYRSFFPHLYYSKKNDLKIINSFLAKGENHHIFISSSNIDTRARFQLTDTTTFSRLISTRITLKNWNNYKQKKSILHLKNSNRKDTTTLEYADRYLIVDSLKHISLGTINDTVTNFIKLPYNNGNSFFIHSNPSVFTNYAMLNENLAKYSTEALTHMEDIEYVIWDEYYKPSHSFMGSMNIEKKSPLYLVNENRPLYIAKILTFLGCILLIFTHFKRRQQAIPIIEPLKNRSVEFATNMGKLYYEKANHYDIAQKKIQFFEMTLQRKFKIDNINKYKNNTKELAQLTGFQIEDINEYFKRKLLVELNTQLQEEQLIAISNAIENMKKNQQ